MYSDDLPFREVNRSRREHSEPSIYPLRQSDLQQIERGAQLVEHGEPLDAARALQAIED